MNILSIQKFHGDIVNHAIAIDEVVLTCSQDKTVRCLVLRQGELREVQELRLSDPATYLYHNEVDNTIIFGTEKGAVHKIKGLNSADSQECIYVGKNYSQHNQRIRGIFKYSSDQFLTVCQKGCFTLWNADRFISEQTLEFSKANYIRQVDFYRNQKQSILIINDEVPLLKACHVIYDIFSESGSTFKTLDYPSQQIKCCFKIFKGIIVQTNDLDQVQFKCLSKLKQVIIYPG